MQQSLDKFERGDATSLQGLNYTFLLLNFKVCINVLLFALAELIKKNFSGHKQSIDLLDGLDFEFLSGLRTSGDEGDGAGGGLFDDDMFDFANDSFLANGTASVQPHNGDRARKNSLLDHYEEHRRSPSGRVGSIDGLLNGSFRLFDNMHMFRGHSFGDEAGMGGEAGLGGGDDSFEHHHYDDEIGAARSRIPSSWRRRR